MSTIAFGAETLLFVPGHRADRFDRAMSSGAGAVCLDLEDGVPDDRKREARSEMLAFLGRTDSRATICVRINGTRTAAGLEDLHAIRSASRHVIVLLPKVEAVAEVVEADSACGDRVVGWIPMIESARGLQVVDDIAEQAPRVTALMFGGADYAHDIGCAFEWEALLHARHRIVQAAALCRVAAIDVPFLQLDDADALASETRRARALGFGCKAAIHPRQVAVIAEAYSPDPAMLAWASRVVGAAGADGGASRVGSEMIDAPIVARARAMLARASLRVAAGGTGASG